MKYTALFIAALAVIAICLRLFSGQQGSQRNRTYKRRQLMTPNEAEFFERLIAALPEHYIFPQVAMAAVIESASGDRKTAHSDRLSIAQQRIDFLVYGKDHQIIAVVELDDRTHVASKDSERDARLMQANIRTVRFQSTRKPNLEELRAKILLPTQDRVGKPPSSIADVISGLSPTAKRLAQYVQVGPMPITISSEDYLRLCGLSSPLVGWEGEVERVCRELESARIVEHAVFRNGLINLQ